MMVDDYDYYVLLEVPHNADDVTIRASYRRLARRYHPDVAGTGSLSRMQLLNMAYAVLSDPLRRRAYDASRGIAPPAAPPAGEPAPWARHVPQAPAKPPHPTVDGPDSHQATAQQTAASGASARVSAGPLRRVGEFAGVPVPVVALSLTGDGRRLGIGLIDGSVGVWDTRTGQVIAALAFGAHASAGVLQGLRLSPSGALVAAWGFSLGLRVWQVPGGQPLWMTSISAPSGLLDLALVDVPPLVRLALPDAPMALAAEDPFRWAHLGRGGTAVLSRPLTGPAIRTTTASMRAMETAGGRPTRNTEGSGWRVQQRALSADGHSLLAFSAGNVPRMPGGHMLSLWELEHRTLRGAAEPRRVAHVSEADSSLRFPFAATPDLSWVVVGDGTYRLRMIALTAHLQRRVDVGSLPDDARVALAPDAQHLALARGPRLVLYDTRSQQQEQTWYFSAQVSALAFAPATASPTLAVGLTNGVTELWSA